ncbi:hypothetical protein SAY87_013296 [Trapa incisa]|uniref:FAE domain-containing protein n=1 Tax=Trapa incisa TaxID=236973 RepID=A0AAN7K8H0_9MYRT|nr:hypothetical protein SAY87_013296 [Trapa incisa]
MPPPLLEFWDFNKLVKYANLAYKHLMNHVVILTLVSGTLGLLVNAVLLGPSELLRLWPCQHLQFDIVSVQGGLCSAFLVTIATTAYCFMCWSRRAILLIDYACWKPPFTYRISFAAFMEHTRLVLKENPKSYEFQTRIFERSGLGHRQGGPQGEHPHDWATRTACVGSAPLPHQSHLPENRQP